MGTTKSKLAPRIEAVVFDSDGTLFNSRELIMSAYRHVATLHNLRPPTDKEIEQHLGKGLLDIYRGLFPEYNDHHQLVRANGRYVADNLTLSAAFQGLRETLETLRAGGKRLGLLTGNNAKVHEVLQHHDVEQLFDSIVHSDRIVRQKPDPEGFHLALRELGVAPEHALMVGDMRYDILTGKNGGAFATVGITHGFGTREELTLAEADYIVDNLGELQQLVQTTFS